MLAPGATVMPDGFDVTCTRPVGLPQPAKRRTTQPAIERGLNNFISLLSFCDPLGGSKAVSRCPEQPLATSSRRKRLEPIGGNTPAFARYLLKAACCLLPPAS